MCKQLGISLSYYTACNLMSSFSSPEVSNGFIFISQELMRREIGKRRGGFSFMSLVLIALLAVLVGYLVKK